MMMMMMIIIIIIIIGKAIPQHTYGGAEGREGIAPAPTHS
jgi:hypothetical protein